MLYYILCVPFAICFAWFAYCIWLLWYAFCSAFAIFLSCTSYVVSYYHIWCCALLFIFLSLLFAFNDLRLLILAYMLSYLFYYYNMRFHYCVYSFVLRLRYALYCILFYFILHVIIFNFTYSSRIVFLFCVLFLFYVCLLPRLGLAYYAGMLSDYCLSFCY